MSDVGRTGNIALLLGAFLPIFIERRTDGAAWRDAEKGVETKATPSLPPVPLLQKNSRHRDRPHKFAIVTMKVEKGGTKEGEGREWREEGFLSERAKQTRQAAFLPPLHFTPLSLPSYLLRPSSSLPILPSKPAPRGMARSVLMQGERLFSDHFGKL